MDTPHTRPVPVTGTAYDAASAAKFGLERSRYEGPTGIAMCTEVPDPVALAIGPAQR